MAKLAKVVLELLNDDTLLQYKNRIDTALHANQLSEADKIAREALDFLHNQVDNIGQYHTSQYIFPQK